MTFKHLPDPARIMCKNVNEPMGKFVFTSWYNEGTKKVKYNPRCPHCGAIYSPKVERNHTVITDEEFMIWRLTSG